MLQLSSSRLSHAASALFGALIVLCVFSFDNLRIDTLFNNQELELDNLERKFSASDHAANTAGQHRADLSDQRMKLIRSQRREMVHQLRWRNMWTFGAFMVLNVTYILVTLRNNREAKAAQAAKAES